MGGMFDHDHDGKLSETERMERDYFIMTEFFDDSDDKPSHPAVPRYHSPHPSVPRSSVSKNEVDDTTNKGLVLLAGFFFILAAACLEIVPIMTLVFIVLASVCCCYS